MDKIISFGKGIRRQSSVGEDSELSELVNLIPRNGELVNVRGMSSLGKVLGSNEVLILVHKTGGGDNYIAINKTKEVSSLVYYDSSWKRKVIDDTLSIDDENIPNIESIGNTLVLLHDGGIRYYLWKDGNYVNLGNKPPQIDISFGLQGECVRTDIITLSPPKGFSVNNDTSGNLTSVAYFSEDKEFINEKVLGEVNRFINDESVEKGRFMYPFLVRYAYRMYDESLIMHSSPVLMVCSTSFAPSFVVERAINVSNMSSPTLECRVMGVTHKLDYSIDTDGIVESLKSWGDIIKSVDIFISPQIQSYDQNGEIGRIRTSDAVENNGYAICKHVNPRDRYEEVEGYKNQYQKRYISEMYATTFSNDWSYTASHLELPSKTEEEVLGALKNESLFYLLETITIDKLPEKGQRNIVEVKDDILKTLTTREVMSDDFYSNDGLSAEYAIAYNSRLTLSGVERVLFDGKLTSSVFPYTDGFAEKVSEDTWESSTQDVRYAVYIKEDGKDIVVGGDLTRSAYGDIGSKQNKLLYFFYPNPNAYKVVVEIGGDGYMYVKYSVELERHNQLNGAFFFNGWENGILETSNNKDATNVIGPSSTIGGLVSADKSVKQRGQIYTSDASNPFFFFPSGVNQIGYGDVIRIETSAKALSQGQFGQFPLYAFCTDGIWALEVASDGSYSAKQPISRDVCNNADSITQIDGAVVFTTDQGLKLIQGSEVVLLSGHMDGHNVDESKFFSKGSSDKGFFGQYSTEECDLSPFDNLVVQETRDFREILSTCKIAYDYPNRLLRIFPEGGGKWYVYSLDTREFACESSLGDVGSVVAGYPAPLVQIGSSLYTFGDGASNDDLRDGLLLTRPIDMGEPFALKKLQDMRLLYTKYNEGTFAKMVVYVSNDRVNWARLTSLRGRSFKYYRVALITRMTNNDTLSGMVMRYTLERTNRLR